MPRLLLFAPCQKVLFSQEEKTISLISLVYGINAVNPNPDSVIPSGSVVPLPWNALAIWYRQPGEEGLRFKQKISLVSLDGEELVSTEQEFTMEKETHQVYSYIASFPIWKTGRSDLKLFLAAPNQEYEERASFPISIHHIDSKGKVLA